MKLQDALRGTLGYMKLGGDLFSQPNGSIEVVEELDPEKHREIIGGLESGKYERKFISAYGYTADLGLWSVYYRILGSCEEHVKERAWSDLLKQAKEQGALIIVKGYEDSTPYEGQTLDSIVKGTVHNFWFYQAVVPSKESKAGP